MSSNGPSLGPDPNSDSRKLSCHSETAVSNRGVCHFGHRVSIDYLNLVVPSPLPAAILSRARKMVWETEPTFLVRDVRITRYGIMADRALDRILPDKRAQDATTQTDFSDSFGISHS